MPQFFGTIPFSAAASNRWRAASKWVSRCNIRFPPANRCRGQPEWCHISASVPTSSERSSSSTEQRACDHELEKGWGSSQVHLSNVHSGLAKLNLPYRANVLIKIVCFVLLHLPDKSSKSAEAPMVGLVIHWSGFIGRSMCRVGTVYITSAHWASQIPSHICCLRLQWLIHSNLIWRLAPCRRCLRYLIPGCRWHTHQKRHDHDNVLRSLVHGIKRLAMRLTFFY